METSTHVSRISKQPVDDACACVPSRAHNEDYLRFAHVVVWGNLRRTNDVLIYNIQELVSGTAQSIASSELCPPYML